MSNAPYGRHAAATAPADRAATTATVPAPAPVAFASAATDPLSRDALQREIEAGRRAEFRLLVWTATSLLAVAILIVVHLLWL